MAWRRRLRDDGPFWLFAAHLWAVVGIALSNLFLGLGVIAAALTPPRGAVGRRYAAVLVPLGLYALVLLVSVTASVDPVESLPALREFLALLTLPFGLLVIRSERRAVLLCDGLALVGAASAVYALGQLVLTPEGVAATLRVRGPFSHYMTLAGFLVLVDLLLMVRLACDPEARRALWRWALLVPVNLAVVATLTRGAWVALFLGFTLLLLVRARHFLGLFLTAAVLFILVAPQPVRQRALSTFNPRDATNYDRLCMLDAGAKMIAHHPLTGIGPNMVNVVYPIYRHPTAVRPTVQHLHSTFLQLAAERGLVALAAYLWLMGGAVVVAVRSYRAVPSRAGPRAALYLGVAVALAAFNIGGLFEDNWDDTEVQRVTLFLIAVPFALRGLAASARERIEPVSDTLNTAGG